MGLPGYSDSLSQETAARRLLGGMRPTVVRSVCVIVLAAGWLPAGRGGASRLDELSRQAMEAVGRQDPGTAGRLLEEGSRLAREAGERRRAALFENALCGVRFLAMQYGASLRACAESIELARAVGAADIMGVAETNRSNFLLSLGDLDGAALGFGRAMGWLKRDSPYRIIALSGLGKLDVRRGNLASAEARLREAVELAGASGDRLAEADAWAALGELELRRGRHAGAERALLAAYRIRRLHKLPQLEAVWWQLGKLELARGRAEAALACFDRGLGARRHSKANFAGFSTWQGKAEALEALGRQEEARGALKRALKEAAAWRNEIAPSEGLEIAADVRVGQIVEALARLAGDRPEAVWEAFAELESARSAGLRRQMLVNRTLAGQLSGTHLAMIREARAAGRRLLRGEPGAEAAYQAAEEKLTKYEAAELSIPAGWGSRLAGGWDAGRLAGRLKPGHALISFLTAETGSRVWVISRGGKASAAIAGEQELAQLAAEQRRAILEGGGQEISGRIYQALFGQIPRGLLEARHWHVVADGPLWSLAWAALRPQGAAGGYLAEEKSLEFLPSAAWLMQRSPEAESEWMVAAGDGIHNRADSRLQPGRGRRGGVALSFWVWPWLAAKGEAEDVFELPALAGSARELDAVCAAWGRARCRRIRGSELNTEKLGEALATRPAVLQLATHLVGRAEEAEAAGQAFLALSLTSDLERDGLWTSGVSRLQAPGGLVVLSACGSAQGRALTGAGLVGFGRAWLAAGARAVIGTLWPVSDNGGEFFAGFYRHLAAGRSPAAALRISQAEAILAGGWRAKPRFWAAYTILGKD